MLIRQKYHEFFMNTALEAAKLSKAKKLQVGAVLVRDSNILSFGYNGTPPGWDNTCEDKDWMPIGGNLSDYPHEEYSDLDGRVIGRYRLKTRPEVIHSEMNAILHLARRNESTIGTSMFITHSPCSECAKLIIGAGIAEVYYRHEYRCSKGLELLKQAGLGVFKI